MICPEYRHWGLSEARIFITFKIRVTILTPNYFPQVVWEWKQICHEKKRPLGRDSEGIHWHVLPLPIFFFFIQQNLHCKIFEFYILIEGNWKWLVSNRGWVRETFLSSCGEAGENIFCGNICRGNVAKKEMWSWNWSLTVKSQLSAGQRPTLFLLIFLRGSGGHRPLGPSKSCPVKAPPVSK